MAQSKDNKHPIPPWKRWLKRLGRLFYGIIVILFIQASWASIYENETRAAMIYGGFVFVLLLAGLIQYVSNKLAQP
jgi:hypothetical protein